MTITELALVQRIRRNLRTTTHVLRKTRGERQRLDCGRYYIIDANRNFLVWHHVDIEAYARDVGVLRAHDSGGGMKTYVGRNAGDLDGRVVSTVESQPLAQPGQLAEERCYPRYWANEEHAQGGRPYEVRS